MEPTVNTMKIKGNSVTYLNPKTNQWEKRIEYNEVQMAECRNCGVNLMLPPSDQRCPVCGEEDMYGDKEWNTYIDSIIKESKTKAEQYEEADWSKPDAVWNKEKRLESPGIDPIEWGEQFVPPIHYLKDALRKFQEAYRATTVEDNELKELIFASLQLFKQNEPYIPSWVTPEEPTGYMKEVAALHKQIYESNVKNKYIASFYKEIEELKRDIEDYKKQIKDLQEQLDFARINCGNNVPKMDKIIEKLQEENHKLKSRLEDISDICFDTLNNE